MALPCAISGFFCLRRLVARKLIFAGARLWIDGEPCVLLDANSDFKRAFEEFFFDLR